MRDQKEVIVNDKWKDLEMLVVSSQRGGISGSVQEFYREEKDKKKIQQNTYSHRRDNKNKKIEKHLR